MRSWKLSDGEGKIVQAGILSAEGLCVQLAANRPVVLIIDSEPDEPKSEVSQPAPWLNTQSYETGYAAGLMAAPRFIEIEDGDVRRLINRDAILEVTFCRQVLFEGEGWYLTLYVDGHEQPLVRTWDNGEQALAEWRQLRKFLGVPEPS